MPTAATSHPPPAHTRPENAYTTRRFITDDERKRLRLGPKPTRYAYNLEPHRSFFPLRLARYPALAETIADEVNAARNRDPNALPLKLADIGSGRGRSLQYTEPLGVADAVEWHGIDLESHRAHNPARWTSLTDANIEQGLPWDDATFDIAVCEQVLEHLTNPTAVLQDIRRILKPRGLIVAGVPVFPAPVAATRRLLVPKDTRKHRVETGHPQTFSAASFARLVTQAGIAVEQVRGFRIISGGPLLRPLENTFAWYRFARRVGAALPGLCVEAQVVARKPQS
jgi:SAM-dependent methyltransferase